MEMILKQVVAASTLASLLGLLFGLFLFHGLCRFLLDVLLSVSAFAHCFRSFFQGGPGLPHLFEVLGNSSTGATNSYP